MCPFEGTRYYALYLYYRKRYAEKVMKASLDAGMTCPNLDGVLYQFLKSAKQ